MFRLLTVALKAEPDVVFARQRARVLAELLGFDRHDQTRIATAVSEVARNAIEYATGGKVDFLLTGKTAPQVFEIRVARRRPRHSAPQGDSCRRTPFLDRTRRRHRGRPPVDGSVRDRIAARQGRLGDAQEAPAAACASFGPENVKTIIDRLMTADALDPINELRRQNQELMFSLEEVERQRKELSTLNDELQDTNRGVVALYAELDEKAEHLRRADELKTRFLSNMSHEFRTPLNSILALSRLLLGREDGPLAGEQERQIEFIRKAAESLSELVNDLLDLAKVEAGKIEIRPAEFSIANLFGALRGMLRPLLVGDRVSLVFEDVSQLPPMTSDEGKISQILRNLISNALKFTEAGEVRVSAALSDDAGRITFSVSDTGIGIAPEHLDVIFREFSQLDNPLQRKAKGTGLGLPLSKRLAEVLGGRLEVESTPGEGSVFSFALPLQVQAVESDASSAPLMDDALLDDNRLPVLAVEDNAADMMVYEAVLRQSPYRLIRAKTIRDARRQLAESRPRAIILDVLLRGEDSWRFLAELKSDLELRQIPVLVVTTVEDAAKAETLGADAYATKPVERSWLMAKLHELIENAKTKRVLLIDDDDASRYIMRRCLAGEPYAICEAATGEAGLLSASEERPDLILLDLKLPGMSGFDVLDRLSAEPSTAGVPVIVVTSSKLNGADRDRLSAAKCILAKTGLSREALAPLVAEALGSGALK